MINQTERQFKVLIIEDDGNVVNIVRESLKGSDRFLVNTVNSWDIGNMVALVVEHDIVDSDCRGTKSGGPLSLADRIEKFEDGSLSLKIILHTALKLTNDKEPKITDLIRKGLLAYVEKGQCNYCDIIRENPFLLDCFLKEREELLWYITREKNKAVREKYNMLGHNIFQYYMKYPELIISHEGECVAIVNGEVVAYGVNEMELIKEVHTKHGVDSFLVRKIEKISH